MSEEDFAKISSAFFDEIERKFL